MGCHTWFYNNIVNMPVNHKEHIKEKLIKDISGFWIMNTSKEEFIKEIQESITDDPKDQFYKLMLKDGYYEDQIKKYNKYLDILHNDIDINSLKLILDDCHSVKHIKDKFFYCLTDFGWHDNFRIYGYPEEVFYDAKTLIEFLKKYEQSMIGSKEPYGFNSDIEKIIYEFFDTYPNGMIRFG